MARVIVTLKIMPTGPDIDLKKVEHNSINKIKKFGGGIGKIEIEPIAFGLKALKIFFIMDEDIGSTSDLENEIVKVDGVNSVEILDVRRTIG